MTAPLPMAAAPVRLLRSSGEQELTEFTSRDWSAVLSALEARPGAVLDAHGQMTDALLAQVARIGTIAGLRLGNSPITDAGLQLLRHMPTLQHLDLSQTAITDAGLSVLRDLPALESLSLSMTGVTDTGMTHLRECTALRRVNVMWTQTGDAAIAALAGKSSLTHFWSGNHVTDAGLAMLQSLPMFTSWRGEEPELTMFSYDTGPNLLSLRGSFSDDGMQKLSKLSGLWGLNLDDSSLQITARAMLPLLSLPRLARLAVDPKDDWMPHIAAMPHLRFLGAQDTAAGDDGFEALSASQSLEYIWGRRCHNLRTRGFRALARMPKLRGLSVSCLNVGDDGVALLPEFPALRELMPMDVPDAGYGHIGRCVNLEALLLMYCRDTTDAATEQITSLPKLRRYFNSYTTITDRTPLLLSGMDSLDEITFDACHNLTDSGVAALAKLPRLRELRVAGNGLTPIVASMFPPSVTVHYSE
jgi:Leucine-rich repeat (LRR) protein